MTQLKHITLLLNFYYILFFIKMQIIWKKFTLPPFIVFFLAGQLPLQVWERARHHLVFTKTALSAMTRREYGSGNAQVQDTAQMLGQYPELHNARVI